MTNLFLLLLIVITESCKQCFEIDTYCFTAIQVTYSGTNNKMKIVRVENWAWVGAVQTINGVTEKSVHDETCVDNTEDSSKFENGWTLSIESHDAVWADRFLVQKSNCPSSLAIWGLSNRDGWCLSTDRNDIGFKGGKNCGNVPANRCWRTYYISDNGSVYVYTDENWSLFGRRLQEVKNPYEALLMEQNGKYYHVNEDGNAIGQAVTDGWNTMGTFAPSPSPTHNPTKATVTPARNPGGTFGPTCKGISTLNGLTSQDLCTQCSATGYCKAKYQKTKDKCKCKKLKCKKCKKDQTCCLTNPEGCTWNPTAKKPCT